MKRRYFITILLLVCSSVVFAGAEKEFTQKMTPDSVRVAALKGPSGIGMAYLFDVLPKISSVRYEVEAIASPDILLPRLLKGELDIAILPPNVAAKVYSTDKSLVIGAVVGNGMLSLLSKDTTVQSLADLSGKTVYVAGQGATPEYVFRYLLKNAGLEDSVTLDFTIPPAEIAAALISGKIDYAVMPEPFASVAVSKDTNIVKAIDIQEEWAKIAGNSDSFPMTIVVIRKEFAEQYPDSVRTFLSLHKESIEWTNAHASEAGSFTEKYGIGVQSAIATAAIPHAAFVFIPAKEAQQSIEQLLSVFLEYAPASVGGTLPDDSFYFE